MKREVVHTPDRVHYTYTMQEFKELLGITEENDVLTVQSSMVNGNVTVLMSWNDK